VAAAPNGNVAVVWIDVGQTGASNIGYTFSTDDGASFGAVFQLKSPGGRVSSDPTVAVDAAQNFWAAWVGYHVVGASPSDMHIYVAEAPAGSTTFGVPVEVSDPADTALYDKPWLTVTSTGELLVTYERDGMPLDYGIVMARSTDGVTWQRAAVADDPTGSVYRNLAFSCAPATGTRIWATYLAYDTALEARLAHSDDGGGTWSAETVVSAPGEAVAFDDPVCVADNDEVWISYGLTKDPLNMSSADASKLSAVRLAHSGDGGQTIDTRIDAHDPSAGTYFMHPLLVRESGGALDLTYYAGNMDKDPAGSFRRSRAAAPVTSFGPSVAVYQPLTFLVSRADLRWLGDYTGLFTRAGKLYLSFAVNDTGSAKIAFAEAMVP
jgi:hypothetical protein